MIQPVGTDSPSALRTAISGNVTVLDSSVTFTQGTLASIPVAGLAGRRYFATDAIIELYDTGSQWIPTGPPSPIGQVAHYAGGSDPTDVDGVTRWLICDGRAINRTTFATLFTRLSTTWGAGNGSTTFNIPDGRGRAFIGAGAGAGLTNRALAASAGEEAHLLSVPEMPSHDHNYNDPGHVHTTQMSSQGTFSGTISPPPHTHDGVNDTPLGSGALNSSVGILILPTGGGGTHNNMQPYLAVNHIIKVL